MSRDYSRGRDVRLVGASAPDLSQADFGVVT
jgi:hypothetical protein